MQRQNQLMIHKLLWAQDLLSLVPLDYEKNIFSFGDSDLQSLR
jgi:hypothetical protein